MNQIFRSVLLFSLAINLLMLVTPIYMMQIFDRVLTSRNTDTLIVLTIIAVVAIATMAGLEAIRNLMVSRFGVWLDRVLAPPIFKAIIETAGVSDTAKSAQTLRDLGTVRKFVGSPAVFPIFDAPWAPIFLAVIFLIHPLLGYVSLAGMSILLVLAILNELLTRKPNQESSKGTNEAYNEADSAVQNTDIILASGMASNFLNHWQEKKTRTLSSEKQANERAAILMAVAKFVRTSMQVGVLGTGAWLAIDKQISAGGMIAASIIMARAVAPVEKAIGTWRTILNSVAAYGRIRRVLNRPQDHFSNTELPAPEGRLEARTVSWKPNDQKEPLIKGISLDLKPGDALGIIGPSAAGKTTFGKLLAGIYVPFYGSIRLDDMEISFWNPEERGQFVGYMPQNIELFNATVKENISKFSGANDQEVIEAAKLAGAHELILRLPKGYETKIGNAGVPLSGGQRQRIALARAIFGKPKLIILDEPNAHLDQRGEESLISMIEELRKRNCVIVMITQRTLGISAMNKLLVMRDGYADLFGERDEVIAKLKERTPRITSLKNWQLARGGEGSE